jgi:hypothetical protein
MEYSLDANCHVNSLFCNVIVQKKGILTSMNGAKLKILWIAKVMFCHNFTVQLIIHAFCHRTYRLIF